MTDKELYDVVIVGAGTAGITLAYLLADKGFNIALVDRRYKNEIGDKICGDAIAAHHFKSTGLQPPSNKVIRKYVKGIKVYPKDMRYHLTVETEDGGYIVDRHKYGQELLENAINRGTALYDGIIISGLIIEDNIAKGVYGYKRGGGELIELNARITVDASGYPAVLVNKSPESWGLEKKISKRDVIIAYREIVEVKEPLWDLDNLHLHFISEYAPTGYVWIFPWSKDGRILNFGNGVIPDKRIPKPNILLEKYVEDVKPRLLKDRRIIKKGSCNIPNRRARNIFVGNGFLAVGDAAIMIDPATAEGIGYGIYGAYLAAGYISEALEAKDYSQERLWKYQHAYMTSPYGVRQARLDVFKYLLQAYSDLDYQFVIQHKILTSRDVIRARDEDSFITAFDKTVRTIKAAIYGRTRIIKDLKYTIDVMKLVKDLYIDYPETPSKMGGWIRTVEKIFLDVNKRFPPYIPY